MTSSPISTPAVKVSALIAAVAFGSGCVAVAGSAATAHSSIFGDTALSAQSVSDSFTSPYVDDLDRPTELLQQRVDFLTRQPWLPPEVANTLKAGVDFGANSDPKEGPELLAPEETPEFTKFLWPTVSGQCIDGSMNAVGTAIAVPGPSELPAPGATEGQTSFVFTAMGTSAAAQEQGDFKVTWLNLDTLAFGTTELANHGLNPEGPATVTGVADTGRGVILAVIGGDVATQDTSCTFAPTAALINSR